MTENTGTIIVGCLPSVPRLIRHLRGKAVQGSEPVEKGQYPRSENHMVKRCKRGAFISTSSTTMTDEQALNGEYIALESTHA